MIFLKLNKHSRQSFALGNIEMNLYGVSKPETIYPWKVNTSKHEQDRCVLGSMGNSWLDAWPQRGSTSGKRPP